jgi:hypothetical protein
MLTLYFVPGSSSHTVFTAVIPRESGVSSTPRLLDSIASALEYWIIRWILSSGGALRRPGGG